MTDDIKGYLFGIPLRGYFHPENMRQQRPIEEFRPILEAVLTDPTVIALGWSQYIPGFNDGDPCVFNTTRPWCQVEVSDEAAEAFKASPEYENSYNREDDDEGWCGGDDTGAWYTAFVGEMKSHYERLPDGTVNWKRLIMDGYAGPDEERFGRVEALMNAIIGGEFDTALQTVFGYNCSPAFTRTAEGTWKCEVDSYDCGY